MPATSTPSLFGDDTPVVKKRDEHQVRKRYRLELIDRIEEATSRGGSLDRFEIDTDFYGELLKILFPEEFGLNNWQRGVHLDPDEF